MNVPDEISKFCIETLKIPETKENPAMVAAIAELLKVVSPI
jgi:hypothetical protein